MSHITIARVKKIKDKNEFLENINSLEIPKISFIVNEFCLIESTLSEIGPIYTVLDKFSLKWIKLSPLFYFYTLIECRKVLPLFEIFWLTNESITNKLKLKLSPLFILDIGYIINIDYIKHRARLFILTFLIKLCLFANINWEI